MFDDLLQANRAYAHGFRLAGLAPRAAKGLAVVTCIDSRIEPLAMLGLEPGDAKILRNAGARVTPDVLRSLTLAANLLGVRRVALVQHTGCAMNRSSNAELVESIGKARGVDASDWDFLAIDDPERVLASDAQLIRDCALLPPDLDIGAFIYDVETGFLQEVNVTS